MDWGGGTEREKSHRGAARRPACGRNTHRVGHVERVVVGVGPAHALDGEGKGGKGLAVVAVAHFSAVELAGGHQRRLVRGGEAAKGSLGSLHQGVVVDA